MERNPLKIKIEIDTSNDKENEIHDLISRIYGNETKNPGQQKLEPKNNNDTVSVVLRDGENKTTQSVKDDLKRLGFNYYKYKKNSKIEDPRYTQTCKKTYWDEIKNHTTLQGLDIWTSIDDGGMVNEG